MKKFTRRSFIKSSAALGGATLLSYQFLPNIIRAGLPPDAPELFTIPGDYPIMSIQKLFDALGGIEKFVRSGESVGILVNSPWIHPGTYTKPDVSLAVAHICKEAGAKEIICFKQVRENYWEESQYFEEMKPLIKEIKYGDERTEVSIPNAKELERAELFRVFMDVDVFINIPVAKHHAGTLGSGTLKGLMGVTSRNTNRNMHSPDGEYTYSKQEYLSQCIADLGLVRQPDLCIMDAIECCLENGPRGPGETIRPNKIIAGIDPVATDVYGMNLMGFGTDEVITSRMAHEHGLGEMDMEKIKVVELE